ncbi:energy transducer TonB [Rufibacter roseolus]|uniref:energy transducer TonB n=1 Tax=Rufibacter roseolus TaxID=2817375 RepID=UPI001B314E3E|nr:energy transducer TonB [Rufibacter roseolus]
MRFIFCFILSLLSVTAFSQEVRYFSERFQTQRSVKTGFERRYFLEANKVRTEDYEYDTLKQKSFITGTTSLDEADDYLWYVRVQADYLVEPYFSNLKARVHTFTKAGQPSSDIIANGTRVLYAQLWNSDNIPYLVKGTGNSNYWNKDSTENSRYFYKDSLLVSAFTYRPAQKDFVFIKLDQRAEPKTGIQAFVQKLASTIPYPENELYADVQATIYIQFTVDDKGHLGEFKALNSSYDGFNKVVLQKLEASTAWNPALVNGRRVKSRYTIPVSFQIMDEPVKPAKKKPRR